MLQNRFILFFLLYSEGLTKLSLFLWVDRLKNDCVLAALIGCTLDSLPPLGSYFGKTLNMSMVEKFFSINYAGRGELFEDLAIWQEEGYRLLQGTCPVISLSFAKVKAGTFADARRQICRIITELYNKNDFLLEGDCLNEKERADFQKISADMENYLAAGSLNDLSGYLSRYYGKKVIILLVAHTT